ncbi:MAG: hypothetical protein IT385_14325 [Deltaproteobacteria bacterium]|nr:hypothetical protein [Deltaproteobacteria bacterium]
MTALVLLTVATLFGAEPDPRAEADRLVAEGAALGQKGRWDEAIARFEEAERHFPRAIHACNIGLAHARADRPEKALLHLTACQARATEPLPAWVPKRIDETRAALNAGRFAPLELVPRTLGARVTLDHFGDQPLVPPVTVWLPFGEHRLRAELAGHVALDEALVIDTKAALRRMIDLPPEPIASAEPTPEPGPEAPPEPGPEAPPELGVEPAPEPTSTLPAWIVIAAGGGALATGAIFYGLALGSQSDAESFEAGSDDFEEADLRFKTQRSLAYGFLAGGAAVTAVGVVLLVVLDDADDVAVQPTLGGAVARFRF